MFKLVFPLGFLVSSVLASLTGQILLTNHTVPLDISTRITLGGRQGYQVEGTIYGPESPQPEYHFSFPSHPPIPRGGYALRLESRKYEFQSYYVKVGEDDRVEVALFDEKSLKMLPGTWLPLPLVIRPLRLYPLEELPPPSLSLVQILKQNPLIWLLGLGLVFMLAIPKLMENLDEETLKEVRESQKEMHQNMASLQNFDSSKFSKFLAGGNSSSATTTEEGDAIPDLTTVQPKTTSSTSKSGAATGGAKNGGKSKKRK